MSLGNKIRYVSSVREVTDFVNAPRVSTPIPPEQENVDQENASLVCFGICIMSIKLLQYSHQVEQSR